MKTFILLSVFLISNSSFSQNWVYVGSSVSGDKYYLRDSNTNESGYKKVWSKQVSKRMTYKKGNKTYTLINGYCLDLKEYDCTGKQLKLVSFAYYNSKGIVVYSYQFQSYETDWNDVLPDSVGEMLLDKVCELF
jgi:hypothetical protein